MDETNAIVKRGEIGVAFGDELTANEKVQIVKEYVEGSLVPYNERISKLIEFGKTFIITNDDERKQAASIFLEIQREIDDAKSLRKKLLARAKSEIRSIEIPFSELEKLQDQAVDDFKGKLKKDWLDFESARKDAQDIAAAEAEKERSSTGAFVPAPILPETERRINTDFGYTSIRKTKKVTVKDKLKLIQAVAQNPLRYIPTYLDVNVSKIIEDIERTGCCEIPGVKIEDDVIVAGYKKS